jgi:hypothetical protein
VTVYVVKIAINALNGTFIKLVITLPLKNPFELPSHKLSFIIIHFFTFENFEKFYQINGQKYSNL